MNLGMAFKNSVSHFIPHSCPCDHMSLHCTAQAAILTEEARLKEYLHSSSAGEMMGAVHAELIAAVLEPLLSKDTGADFMFQVRPSPPTPPGYRTSFDHERPNTTSQ